MKRSLLLGVWLACCSAVLTTRTALADGAPAAEPEPLPELPRVPSLELPRPERADLEELERRLHGVCAEESFVRERSVRELLEADASLVPAIRFRLDETADHADKNALKRELGKVRRQARQAEREDEEPKRGARPADYLAMATEHAEPSDRLWCELVSVLAESRMLAQIGTVEAVRGLLGVYVRFGDFLRINTQIELERIGDKAVAALIEARRHPAPKIAKWAARELDTLGKAIPSEAVRTDDMSALADVLRAYGRVRDPDASRIVVSFANSDRAQVREAARQAVALYGEVAAWQLRDSYESVVGKRAPRDWTWERTARELFAEFDRLRSAEVKKLFEAGQSALASGDLEGMKRSFDRVLARLPDYARREPLIQGYLHYAEQRADQHPEQAVDALLRVERLASGSPAEARAHSLRLTLQAAVLEKRAIGDRALLNHALLLDPSNARARAELDRLEHGPAAPNRGSRYAAAAAIALSSLCAIAWILLRRGASAEPAFAGGASPAPVAAPDGDDATPPTPPP